MIDEYTRECIAVKVRRSLKASGVEGVLAKLFLERGRPDYIRSDKSLGGVPPGMVTKQKGLGGWNLMNLSVDSGRLFLILFFCLYF